MFLAIRFRITIIVPELQLIPHDRKWPLHLVVYLPPRRHLQPQRASPPNIRKAKKKRVSYSANSDGTSRLTPHDEPLWAHERLTVTAHTRLSLLLLRTPSVFKINCPSLKY